MKSLDIHGAILEFGLLPVRISETVLSIFQASLKPPTILLLKTLTFIILGKEKTGKLFPVFSLNI